jgi:hypothetical protein
MTKITWAAAHTAAFCFGVTGYFFSINNQPLSSLVLQVCFLYVFIFVLVTKHRHFLPALFMLFAFKIIEFPVSHYLFEASFWLYIGSIILFDGLLAFCLYRYHQSPHLRTWMRVNSYPVPGGIPQVNALIVVLTISVLQALAVSVEVALYKQGLLSADQLFVHPSYQPVKIMLKILELMAVWAMLIDSVYAEENKAAQLLKMLKDAKKLSVDR